MLSTVLSAMVELEGALKCAAVERRFESPAMLPLAFAGVPRKSKCDERLCERLRIKRGAPDLR